MALAAYPQHELPRGPYAAQPQTRAPLHPIQAAPTPPLYAKTDEQVQITASVLIAKPQFIPEKPVELDRKQLDASMKQIKADSATINHQLQTNVRYGEQAHLSPPYPQGQKQPFELRITPKKFEDSITLDLQAKIKALWPGNGSATDVHLHLAVLVGVILDLRLISSGLRLTGLHCLHGLRHGLGETVSFSGLGVRHGA